MTQRGIDIRGTVALAAALLCWCVVPLMLRYLTASVPDGWTSNAVRYPLSAALYLPWLVAAARDRANRRLWALAVIPTLPNIVGQTCWAWSPYYIDPGLLMFIVRVSVVFAIIGAVILFPDERRLLRSGHFWTGLAMNVTGFLTVVLRACPGTGGVTVMGVLIALGCAVFWGAYVCSVRATIAGMNPLRAFAIVSLYTSIGCLALAPLGRPSSLLKLNGFDAGILLLSAAIGIAAAHGLYYIAVQRLGASIPSTITTLTPFITAAGSSFLFHEILSWEQWAGGVLAAIGSALVIWSQRFLGPPAAAERTDGV